MNDSPDTIQPKTESKTKELLKKSKQYIVAGLGGVALTTAAIGGLHAAENDNATKHEATMQISPSPEQAQVSAPQKVELGTVLVDAPNSRREVRTEPTPAPETQHPEETQDTSADDSGPKDNQPKRKHVIHLANDIVIPPSPEPTPPVVEVTPAPTPSPETPDPTNQ